MISPVVMTKYWGINQSMCKEFSFVKMKEERVGFEPGSPETVTV